MNEMTVRSEAEIKACIATIEEIYPPGKMIYGDAIGNYMLGTLAGLKVALGEYPTYAEIDIENYELDMKAFFKFYFMELEDFNKHYLDQLDSLHKNQGTKGPLD